MPDAAGGELRNAIPRSHPVQDIKDWFETYLSLDPDEAWEKWKESYRQRPDLRKVDKELQKFREDLTAANRRLKSKLSSQRKRAIEKEVATFKKKRDDLTKEKSVIRDKYGFKTSAGLNSLLEFLRVNQNPADFQGWVDNLNSLKEKKKFNSDIRRLNEYMLNYAKGLKGNSTVPKVHYSREHNLVSITLDQCKPVTRTGELIGFVVAANYLVDEDRMETDECEMFFERLDEFSSHSAGVPGANDTHRVMRFYPIEEMTENQLADRLFPVVREACGGGVQKLTIAIEPLYEDGSNRKRAKRFLSTSYAARMAERLTDEFRKIKGASGSRVLCDRNTQQILKSHFGFEERPSIIDRTQSDIDLERVFRIRCVYPFHQCAQQLRESFDEIPDWIEIAENVRDRTKPVILQASSGHVDAINLAVEKCIRDYATAPFLSFHCHRNHRRDFYNAFEESINDLLGLNRYAIIDGQQRDAVEQRINDDFGAFRIVDFQFGIGEQRAEKSFVDIHERWCELFSAIAKDFERQNKRLLILVQQIDQCDEGTRKILRYITRNFDNVQVIATAFSTKLNKWNDWQVNPLEVPLKIQDKLNEIAELEKLESTNLAGEVEFQELSDRDQVLTLFAQLGWGTCRDWLHNVFTWANRFFAIEDKQTGQDRKVRHARSFRAAIESLIDDGTLRITSIVSSSDQGHRVDEQELYGTNRNDSGKTRDPDAILRFVSQGDYEKYLALGKRIRPCQLRINASQKTDKQIEFADLVIECFVKGLSDKFRGMLQSQSSRIRFKFTVLKLMSRWNPVKADECQIFDCDELTPLSYRDGVEKLASYDVGEMIGVMLELHLMVANRIKNIDSNEYSIRLKKLVDLILKVKSLTGKWLNSGRVRRAATAAIVELLANAKLKDGKIEFADELIGFMDLHLIGTAYRNTDRFREILTETQLTKIAEVDEVVHFKQFEFPLRRAQWASYQRRRDFKNAREVADRLWKRFEALDLRSAEHRLEIRHIQTVSHFSFINDRNNGDPDVAAAYEDLISFAREGKCICEIVDDDTLPQFQSGHDIRGTHCPGGCCKIFEAYSYHRLGHTELALELAQVAHDYVIKLDNSNSMCIVSGYYALMLLEMKDITTALSKLGVGLKRVWAKRDRKRAYGLSAEHSVRWQRFAELIYLMIESIRFAENETLPYADSHEFRLKKLLSMADLNLASNECRLKIYQFMRHSRDQLHKETVELFEFFELAQQLALANCDNELTHSKDVVTNELPGKSQPFFGLATRISNLIDKKAAASENPTQDRALRPTPSQPDSGSQADSIKDQEDSEDLHEDEDEKKFRKHPGNDTTNESHFSKNPGFDSDVVSSESDSTNSDEPPPPEDSTPDDEQED